MLAGSSGHHRPTSLLRHTAPDMREFFKGNGVTTTAPTGASLSLPHTAQLQVPACTQWQRVWPNPSLHAYLCGQCKRLSIGASHIDTMLTMSKHTQCSLPGLGQNRRCLQNRENHHRAVTVTKQLTTKGRDTKATRGISGIPLCHVSLFFSFAVRSS